MSNEQRIAVIGGGLAGLAAAVRIAESGMNVDLFSMVPVKRSHSVCAQGGINACNEVARQQGYSEYQHFDETIYGGDYLADQGPVLEMANWAPKIIDLLDRMGVPFNRTNEGNRDLRLFGGSLFKRTHFAGATTGQQLLYALDEQTRRYEAEGKINKYEFWEFLWPVIADGAPQDVPAFGRGEGVRCVGLVAQDMRTMQIRSFRADAVVMATGGCGLVFGKSTNSVICTGGAAARCYQAGAWYGNGEMIQVHPTAIPGADKCRLMSESARGEGGRVWVPRKAGDTRAAAQIPAEERWYFLEEKYPKYGNLVPRDIATREIFDVCVNQGMGVDGQNQVYLDLTHKDPDYLTRKLGGIMEIYEKFVGDDPRYEPMKIFPAVHYSMGGMWTQHTPGNYRRDTPHGDHKPGMPAPVDSQSGQGLAQGAPNNMMTNIPGLYAFGEVNYAYHGATRLGANALLSCIFDGLYNGVSVVNFCRDSLPEDMHASAIDASVFENAVQAEQAKADGYTSNAGSGDVDDDLHNPYLIGREMGEWMTAQCTVVKTEEGLAKLDAKLAELRERFNGVRLADSALWTNQTLSYTRAVGDMLIMAEAICRGSIERRESRGSHFRLDHPERHDEQFLKASVAEYNLATKRCDLTWREVDTSLVTPRARTYGKVEATADAKADAKPESKEPAAAAS